MKIAITGATGAVGQLLVPELIEAGCILLVVGRDVKKLGRMFPGINVCEYAALGENGAMYDVLVHLAVANNDNVYSEQEFFKTNVEFLLKVANIAICAKIKRFINISSFHSLEPTNTTAYARSKHEGATALAEISGLRTETIYLPAVYGRRWVGKLARLNTLWPPFARLVFVPLAALKPTVHIHKLTLHILTNAPVTPNEEVVLFDDQDKNPVYVWSKRLIDLTFAISISVLLGWALILMWIAIRLESRGPGLFAQTRIGKNGREFTCYKFRTMKHGTKQAGTHEVSAAAVTNLGAFMRKTKIDELPQIWNIFRNEISLIGPRPCLPKQEELVEERRLRGVLMIKPGISGLGQINGIDMSEPNKLARVDARYIALRSVLFDLKIAIATAIGNGQGDKTKSDT